MRLPRFSIATMLLALLLSVGLAVGGWEYYQLRQRAMLQDALAEARDLGHPVTVAELQEMRRLPEAAEDRTDEWLAALRQLSAISKKKAYERVLSVGVQSNNTKAIGAPGQLWSPDLAASARALLDEAAEPLAKIHELTASNTACLFPLDYSQGFDMSTESLRWVQDAAKVLSIEARMNAQAQDAEGLVHSLLALKQVAAPVENEPLMIALLTRFSVSNLFTSTLCETVPLAPLDDEQLAVLQQASLQGDYSATIQRSLKGERALGNVFYDDCTYDDVVGRVTNPWVMLTLDEDQAAYNRMMTRVVAAFSLPYEDVLPELRRIDDAVGVLFDHQVGDPSPSLSAALLFDVGPLYYAYARATVDQRVGATLIACRRYQLKHNAYPSSLNQLAPEFMDDVLLDPYDGQSLKHRLSEDSIVVYSVFANQQDDGGQIGNSNDPRAEQGYLDFGHGWRITQ